MESEAITQDRDGELNEYTLQEGEAVWLTIGRLSLYFGWYNNRTQIRIDVYKGGAEMAGELATLILPTEV